MTPTRIWAKNSVSLAVREHALITEVDVVNDTLNERQNNGGVTGNGRKLFTALFALFWTVSRGGMATVRS